MAAFLFLPAAFLAAYSDGPPGATTGGFGEPNCRKCHFDEALNDPGGEMTLDFPPRFLRGQSYVVKIALKHPRLQVAGFELSTRYRQTGKQAGTLRSGGLRTRVISDEETSVQYIGHTRAGLKPTAEKEAEWRFTWVAPDEPEGEIAVHLSANAGNYDDSEFGDFIYILSTRLQPANR